MKKSKLTEKVEKALEKQEDMLFKQKNIEKAIRLDKQYSHIEPDPFHYSVEQAIGLPCHNKG